MRSAEETMRDVAPMLEMGASFNFYMFHGGTNFGFTNGANHTASEYQPVITSYDYSSPVSECGDLTPTYYALREALAKHNGGYCDIYVENGRKMSYGRV